MQYINTQTNQYPLSEQDIRLANPNTSYPLPFAPGEPYAVVFPAPQPTHDAVIQTVRQIAPVLTDKGHWEQRWEVVPRFTEYTDDAGVVHTVAAQEAAAVAAAQAAAAESARAQAKAAREAAVAAIKVTTVSGKTFDGDEVSQGRMARAIIGLQAANAPSITWVLADNTPATVTLAELTEALVLAGQAQAAIWVV
jgi:hypothetical protein